MDPSPLQPEARPARREPPACCRSGTGLWWHTRDEIRSAHAYGLTRIFKDSWLQATDVRVKRLSDEIADVHAALFRHLAALLGVLTAILRLPAQALGFAALLLRQEFICRQVYSWSRSTSP
jgi:hypothetical protein